MMDDRWFNHYADEPRAQRTRLRVEPFLWADNLALQSFGTYAVAGEIACITTGLWVMPAALASLLVAIERCRAIDFEDCEHLPICHEHPYGCEPCRGGCVSWGKVSAICSIIDD